jgi:hypothetical protein
MQRRVLRPDIRERSPVRFMPPPVRAAIASELAAARAATAPETGWRALERAHIFAQPWAIAHVRVHWRMLGLALRHRDRRDVVGQVVRLIAAAPGSVSG